MPKAATTVFVFLAISETLLKVREVRAQMPGMYLRQNYSQSL
jgi:hypothetical protein